MISRNVYIIKIRVYCRFTVNMLIDGMCLTVFGTASEVLQRLLAELS